MAKTRQTADLSGPVAWAQNAAQRARASGSAADLETAARAALVDRSETSEKGSAERLQGAKDKIKAETTWSDERTHSADRSEEEFDGAPKAAERPQST